MTWPLQSEMDQFYGNPRNRVNPSVVDPMWLVDNMSWVQPRFVLYYDGHPVKRFQAHKKVVESLSTVFEDIWDRSKASPQVIREWGADQFGGCYNYRLKRQGATLSCHAYGAAIDLDPARNGMGNKKPHFTPDHPVVLAFKAQGWVWGGDWSGKGVDAMHFQAARVR